MNVHSAILSFIFLKIVCAQIEQIPAPKLAGGEKFQPWVNPGPPYTDTKQIKAVAQERSSTKIGSVRPERRIQNGDYKLFLPGLGIVKDYVPEQIPKRPQRQSITESSVDDGLISPVSVVVSDKAPPPSLSPGEKCEYVQMKGDKLEGNCMKGGMSCDRQCKYNTEDPVCTTILTVVITITTSQYNGDYIPRTSVKMYQRRCVRQ